MYPSNLDIYFGQYEIDDDLVFNDVAFTKMNHN